MLNTSKCDPKLLAGYMAHEVTSAVLAAHLGCHPVTVRRSIKRPPRVKQAANKTALIKAREAFRATKAHLPVREMLEVLHISRSTAHRIKTKYNGNEKAL